MGLQTPYCGLANRNNINLPTCCPRGASPPSDPTEHLICFHVLKCTFGSFYFVLWPDFPPKRGRVLREVSYKVDPRYPQRGRKLAPRRAQAVPRTARIAVHADGVCVYNDSAFLGGPKKAPNWSQDDFKRAPMAQDGPKMNPRSPQDGPR